MKRFLLMMAALGAAIIVFAALTLPPPRLALAPSGDGTVPGILHVHTSQSDGRSAPDEIAAVAARAGAKFIVFTDHGDATRPPELPVYRSGVLCLTGVEISTAGGHYIALDMPTSPYPLAGEARDVVEDVRRLGGFGIVAHPDSPKRELRWSAWDAPFDAVEWINPDTSWRIHAAAWRSRFRLLEGLLHYPVRPVEALASLLTRPDEAIASWSTEAARRRVVGLGGTDGHANLALSDADPGEGGLSIPLPSYEAVFGLLSVRVMTERELTGDAAVDAALVLSALRAGHLYTTVDGLATPPDFAFTASSAAGTAGQGDELASGAAVSLRVRSNLPPGFTTSLYDGSRMLVSQGAEEGSELTFAAEGEPAVYRVEIHTSDADNPRTWLLSNAIYVRSPAPRSPTIDPPAATAALALFDGKTDSGWHLETDPSSMAAVDVPNTLEGFELRVRFGLATGSPGGEWAALVWGTPIGSPPVNVADYDRLTFTGRAERPMRISVQLRTLDIGQTLRRWQRSVYLDTSNRDHTVYFDDFVPAPGSEPREPPLDEVTQILFVVDTTNTRPGTSGRFWIQRAALER